VVTGILEVGSGAKVSFFKLILFECKSTIFSGNYETYLWNVYIFASPFLDQLKKYTSKREKVQVTI
jgi:hypothetical protein